MKSGKLPYEMTAAIKATIRLKTMAYNAMIAEKFPPNNRDAEGLFGPKSMTWHLYRKPGIIVGSYQALLLQLAHPAVADGVNNFSDFNKDYLGRAERTFTSMIKIWFGDKQTALKSGKKLYHIHSMIRGTVNGKSGRRNILKPYCANDPDLLLWVLATLVNITISAYEKVVEPLTLEQKNQFFEESKITAAVMGIPSDTYPKNYDAFQKYFSAMVEGEELNIPASTLTLSKAVLNPPYFPSYLAKVLSGGFLPDKIRNAYEIPHTKKHQRAFKVVVGLFQLQNKLTPGFLGYTPPYYQAHYRVAKAKGLRPKIIDWLFNKIASSRYMKAFSLPT